MIKAEVETELNFDEVRYDVEKQLEKGLETAAIAVEGQAVKLAPVNSNRLRGSITYNVGNKKKSKPKAPATLKDIVDETVKNMEAVIGSGVEYAAHVEYGTDPHWAPVAPLKEWAKRVLGDEEAAYAIQKNIAKKGTKPQPFMRPALDENRKNIKRIIEKAIQEVVNKYKG